MHIRWCLLGLLVGGLEADLRNMVDGATPKAEADHAEELVKPVKIEIKEETNSDGDAVDIADGDDDTCLHVFWKSFIAPV